MNEAITETERRRRIQEEYNLKHGIVPQTILKAVSSPLEGIISKPEPEDVDAETIADIPLEDINRRISTLKRK